MPSVINGATGTLFYVWVCHSCRAEFRCNTLGILIEKVSVHIEHFCTGGA